MPLTGDLRLLVEIVEEMQQRIVVRDLDDRPARQHLTQRRLDDGPLVVAVKIVDDEKAAAQQVLTEPLGLGVRRAPVAAAGLLSEQPRVVEQPIVGQLDVPAVVGDRKARHALERRQKIDLGLRIIDRPPRHEEPARSAAARRRVPQPRDMESGLRRTGPAGHGTGAALGLTGRHSGGEKRRSRDSESNRASARRVHRSESSMNRSVSFEYASILRSRKNGHPTRNASMSSRSICWTSTHSSSAGARTSTRPSGAARKLWPQNSMPPGPSGAGSNPTRFTATTKQPFAIAWLR